jgi:cobalamin biosynthesis protein CobW
MSKIPATIITGFLGAGKSTLIRSLLEQAEGKQIALIINEFGDVGVDGDLLKSCGSDACGEEDIVELANGCICCTVADEFIPAMAKLLAREPQPDHIIIETSGLALPQPLVKAFNWPDIRANVTVDGVVTMVDGAAVRDGLFATDPAAVNAQRLADDALDHDTPLGELFEDQLNCADMVILNKMDLLSVAEVEKVKGQLQAELGPRVSIVGAENGQVPISVLLGIAAAAEDDTDNRLSHHERDHGHEDHDHDDFTSFVVPLGAVTSKDDVMDVIGEALREQPILRLKGFVAIAGADARLVVQAVGQRIESYFDRPWAADEIQAGSLVVIGEKGLDEVAIRQLFQRWAPLDVAAE